MKCSVSLTNPKIARIPQKASKDAMKPLADADVRTQIRSDLDATLIVEAAAGTGKTTELVNRIVWVVASGRSELKKIVAVTFTDKRGRIKATLAQ